MAENAGKLIFSAAGTGDLHDKLPVFKHPRRIYRQSPYLMLRHILMISTGTFASRLLGYLRDAMIAALLGAGPVADAFLVAFQFINVARRSLTEGALNASFIPGYLRMRESEGETAAAAYAGRVLGSVSVLLIGIALV